MGRLDGKVAIITGAANGIGAAAARRFAAEGACLVLVARDAEKVAAMAASIGPAASHVVADVSREDDTQRYVAAAVERHGGFDIVRNAMDHGVENKETRKQKNKPEVANVTVSSKQMGGNVIIDIIDDGGGINRDPRFAKSNRKETYFRND